jgi:hypothetical protein
VLLRDPRVNPCVDENFALRWAVTNQKTDVINLLINDRRMQEVVKQNDYLFDKSANEDAIPESRKRRTTVEQVGR